MGFQQGLSGLSAASTNLDVIGNNIANANTVGFKAGTAEFADLFANSLGGGVSNGVGLGARVSQVAQSFTEGNLQTTSNPLDTAINGDGFFVVNNAGSLSYSRDGQLQVNANGYLVNSTGGEISGYTANAAGTITQGAATPIQINTANLAGSATTTASEIANLDSSDTVPATAVFNPTDATSYNKSNSMTVYDSLGDPHTLTTYYQLQPPATVGGPTNTWNVYATMDGTPVTVNGGVSITNAAGATVTNAAMQVQFNSSGTIQTTTPTPLPAALSAVLSNGATTPFNINFSLTGSTAEGTAYSFGTQTQNGYAPGTLTSFAIGSDGTINGSYSNGQTKALGQVVLASFTDPNGLQPTGNNAWLQTSASGQPVIGTAGSGNLGTLDSSTLEASNVDLTSSLVNMISAQRVYQANAETIKAQDTIMQTITSLF